MQKYKMEDWEMKWVAKMTELISDKPGIWTLAFWFPWLCPLWITRLNDFAPIISSNLILTTTCMVSEFEILILQLRNLIFREVKWLEIVKWQCQGLDLTSTDAKVTSHKNASSFSLIHLVFYVVSKVSVIYKRRILLCGSAFNPGTNNIQ